MNIWSKKVLVNIIYPSTVNKFDVYLDVGINSTYLIQSITRDNQLNKTKRKRNGSQGGGKGVIYLG